MTEEARNQLISILKRNLDLQSKGEIFGLDQGFDDFLVQNKELDADLRKAVEFWEAWADESNHGYPGFYEPIKKAQWPQLAQEIIEKLTKKESIINPMFQRLFPPGKIRFHWGRFIVSTVILSLFLFIFFPMANPVLIIGISIAVCLWIQGLIPKFYKIKRK